MVCDRLRAGFSQVASATTHSHRLLGAKDGKTVEVEAGTPGKIVADGMGSFAVQFVGINGVCVVARDLYSSMFCVFVQSVIVFFLFFLLLNHVTSTIHNTSI